MSPLFLPYDTLVLRLYLGPQLWVSTLAVSKAFYFSLIPQLICSYVFAPLAFVMGVSWEDSFIVGELIGIKTFLNEFVSYERLSVLIKMREEGKPEYVDKVKQYISVSL